VRFSVSHRQPGDPAAHDLGLLGRELVGVLIRRRLDLKRRARKAAALRGSRQPARPTSVVS
jgi:hypothetical protein